jgi:hypothetical protein
MAVFIYAKTACASPPTAEREELGGGVHAAAAQWDGPIVSSRLHH